MNRATPRKRASTRRKSTSLDRNHRFSLITSTVLALAALLAIGVGLLAWAAAPNPTVAITSGTQVSLGATPRFSAGVTLFVRESDIRKAEPASWQCTLEREGNARPLSVLGDVERSGTRVVDGQSVWPALVVGVTRESDSLSCPNLPMSAWSMPTDAGISRTPLAMVVGGIAALGLAALVHPRSRGLGRFHG